MAEALINDPRKKLYSALVSSPDKDLAGQVKKFSYNKFNSLLDNTDFVKDLFLDISERGVVLDPKNPRSSQDPNEFISAFVQKEIPQPPPAPKAQVAPVAPPPVEQVAPPVGIAAPKPVKEPAPSVTDITRQMAFQPPVEALVEPVQMEPQGFFEGLGTQFKRGLAQGRAIQSVNMGQLRDAAQGKNLGAIPYEQIAAANKAVKEFGQTQSDIDLATKEGVIKDAWDVVKALPGVTIESLASLGRSGLEEALVGAGTGAAAGSIIPGLGTAAGGGLGATAGMVQAGRNMEYFGTLMQELEANGVDITDARQLREGLAKYGKSADKTAITRANTIAAVESALPIAGKAAGALAGRVGSKVAQKPLQAVSKALTYEPIAGPLGGATGELAAQVASGQPISPQEIALEAGGESAATVAAVAKAIKGEKKTTDKVLSKIQQRNKIVQAMESAVEANPEAAGQIRQQYQKRINEAAPTDEEVLSAYESLSVLPETEEKNAIRENLEGYMAEKGIAPQAEAVTAPKITAPEAVTETAPIEELPPVTEEAPATTGMFEGIEGPPMEEAAPVAPAEEEVFAEEVPAEPVAPEAAPEAVAAAPAEEAAPEAPAAPAPKGRKKATTPKAEVKEEAPAEEKTSSDYGNYLLDLIEQKQKDLGWKDYTELRKGLVKSFEQTKQDRGESRAIGNLESIYVGYLPEGTQAGAYQAIRKNFEKQQKAPKPEPAAKKIDKKSVQASLDKAKEEYEKAKSAFDKKRSELDKTTREDVKDLFGERKVEMKAQGLFEMPRISPGQREKIIQPFRDRMNKAKEEVNRLTKMLEEGEEVSQKISFNKAVEEIKSKPLSHVFGIKMGSNQAEGTYISTEKENRYAKSAPNAKISKAEVSIENPLVVTDDIGLVDLRNKILNRNLVEFTEEDFELYEIPDEPTVDDLNESGVEKLSKLVTKDLKAKGYDSIYFPESKIQEGELIVFDRKNVKFTEYEQVQRAGEKVRERKGAPKAERAVRPKAKPVRNAGKSPNAITARTITIYGDPYATSLQYLMDATYHPNIIKAIWGSKGKEKKLKEEHNRRIQFLDVNSPIKKTDRLAEILAERYAEENNMEVEDAAKQHDFQSIGIEIITDYVSRKKMVEEILRLNEQQSQEFDFMYNPEAIYGEGYNEDIAKEIDGIMDELPDSYWEGREITDEEFNNLFAEEVEPETKEREEAAPEFTSQQSSEAATAFDKAKTSKGFDKKYGKGAYKALSDITKNFEDIMDKVSEKIKQDCIV